MGIRKLEFLKNIRYLLDLFPGYIQSIKIFNNEIFILVRDSKFLEIILISLLKHQLFLVSQLIDLIVVDHLIANKRFQIFYTFLSCFLNYRLTISIFLMDFEPMKSLTNLFHSVNWLEREAWDLFGIFFSNHKDLRRILTDYGFQGHPLRKDFPLTGFLEIVYNEEQKTVVYEPVEVMQEFRLQEGLSPWQSLLNVDR